MSSATITAISSSQFNQDVSKAQKAAQTGPVLIDSGHSANVLLSLDVSQKIMGKTSNIADLLAMDGSDEVELELPLVSELALAAEFE